MTAALLIEALGLGRDVAEPRALVSFGLSTQLRDLDADAPAVKQEIERIVRDRLALRKQARCSTCLFKIVQLDTFLSVVATRKAVRPVTIEVAAIPNRLDSSCPSSLPCSTHCGFWFVHARRSTWRSVRPRPRRWLSHATEPSDVKVSSQERICFQPRRGSKLAIEGVPSFARLNL